jgi:hypothetical protein
MISERPRILTTLRAFQPVRVPHGDVSHIEGDAASRWGLRVRTTSGVLDTRLVIPDTLGNTMSL